MAGFLDWMEEKVLPPIGRVAENVYLQSIRDAFVIFALPVIITGSVFLIIANPPVGINWAPIHAWQRAVEPIAPMIMVPFNLTFGLVALVVAFGVGFSLGERRDIDAIMSGLLAMLTFLIVSVPIVDIAKVPFGDILANLGGQGLFVALIVGILATEAMAYLLKRGLTFQMPPGVPPYVVRTFRAFAPFLLVIPAAWALEWLVWARTGLTLPALILKLFRPLVAASDTYPAALAEIFLMMLLWSLGIHGMNVVSSVAYPFWTNRLAANAAAAAAHQPPPGIVTEPFFHMFTHLGGSGTTWPLVIYLLLSRSVQLRQVGKASLIPAIFNINEPVIFGVPLVLNPLMMIPLILAPMAVVTVNYLAFALNLVPRVVIQPPFTVPVGLGGLIATGGAWQAVVLQLVNLAIAAVIYYPFFKRYEAELVRRERAAQEAKA